MLSSVALPMLSVTVLMLVSLMCYRWYCDRLWWLCHCQHYGTNDVGVFDCDVDIVDVICVADVLRIWYL